MCKRREEVDDLSTVAASQETARAGFSLGKIVRAVVSNYLVRRLVKAFFTILFDATLVYFLVRLMPSNPVEVYINELIVQYSLTYAEARDQAASLFAIGAGGRARGSLGILFFNHEVE